MYGGRKTESEAAAALACMRVPTAANVDELKEKEEKVRREVAYQAYQKQRQKQRSAAASFMLSGKSKKRK